MKRKGFTLIELLAVIVILAVIALISTPMILGIIEKAKKGGAESSALGYIDAVEKTIATNMLDTNKTNIKDGVYEVSKLKSEAYSVKVKGEEPTDDSWIRVEKGQVTECSLKIGEYIINCNGETIKNGEITTKPDGLIKSGATMEAASSTDTHKGIIYLDPTNLNNICTKELAESNLNEKGTPTEVKTGCMKWYIYAETDNEYTMILDHNTTNTIKWYNANKNVAYEESNIYSEVDDLKTSNGWVVNPRIISAEEVNTITGKTGWTNTGEWYYFDNKNQIAISGSVSKYAWLYDYTNDCTNYGCNIKDSNSYKKNGMSESGVSYQYWISTTYGDAGSDTYVWNVNRTGCLYYAHATDIHTGIRPVITINQ